MDLQLADAKNPVLGQDFLTWLWFKSETRDAFTTPGGVNFVLTMAERLEVRGGGDSQGVETASVSGPTPEFREARLGLRMGKRVSRALLKIESEHGEWTVTLKAEDFCLGSLKTPKVEQRREDGDDPDAAFLEKMFLLEQATDCLDSLYSDFLRLRLAPDDWKKELALFKDWLKGE